MKSYKKMYMSSYSQENFYVDKFEMGADAYREGYDGIVEKLRVTSVWSINKMSQVDLITSKLIYDYYAVFNDSLTRYVLTFESDGEIDELPEIDEIIYC